jgi:hypothetical protein
MINQYKRNTKQKDNKEISQVRASISEVLIIYFHALSFWQVFMLSYLTAGSCGFIVI